MQFGRMSWLRQDRSSRLILFVLRDEVPANGESWLLGQCVRLAAATGLRGLGDVL
jgi:hypothetical protein